MKRFSLLFFAGVASAVAPASAHVTLEHQTAHAGNFYKANFKVGHGCGNSPIRQIVVNIPAGVQGARPMPKPGWDLAIERATPASSHQEQGRQLSDDVVRIRWTAKTEADVLHPEHYDEFALHARLPRRTGPLYWSVSQICVEGRIDWAQVPQAGQSAQSLKTPAAVLDLLPASGGTHHH